MVDLKLGDLVLAEIPEPMADELVRLADQAPGQLTNNIELSMGGYYTSKVPLGEVTLAGDSLYQVSTHTEVKVKLELLFVRRHVGKKIYDQRGEEER